ncbi:hypothetical protein M1403_03380 [Patescibacteria group bacterium]|nr:hypothetical protein [Patescibacteria group bacterium]
MATNLSLHIFSPLEDIFTGDIASLSSKNSSGPFDILPQHANFVTLINKDPITARLPDGSKKVFEFPQAVLRCHEGKIEVFTDFSQAEMLLPEGKFLI